MKKNLGESKLAKIVWSSGLVTLSVIGLLQTSIAAEVTEKDKTEARVERESKIEKENAAHNQLRIAEMALHMNMPVEDLKAFFKSESQAGRLTSPASRGAWNELLRAASNDSISAETTKSYIHLMRSGAAGEFHISETDLVEIKNKWTADQRTNFGKVLRRASEIASNRGTATLEDAFEKALGELGFLDKYRKGCSI